MRIGIGTTLPLIMSLLFLSCNEKGTSLNQSEKEIVRDEVRSMLDNYFKAIKREGLQAEFDYLDNSEDFFWVPPGYRTAISYDSVKAVLIQNSGSLKSVDFLWNKLAIYPLSNDIANYTGIVRGSLIMINGEVSQVNMIETGTVIRRSDGWKILSGQSRNLPD